MVILQLLGMTIALVCGVLFIFLFPSLIMIGEESKEDSYVGVITEVDKIILSIFNEFKQIQMIDIINFWKTPMVHDGLSYSMMLLVFSLIISTVLGILYAIFIHLLPSQFSKKILRFLGLFEGVPDLLIILVLQLIVIYLYKQTGIKFLKLYGIGQTPYFVPIFIASFLPSIFITQFFVKFIAEELNKDYVVLAKAKGLGLAPIILKHILPNTIPFYLFQMKVMIWILLAQIFMIERIFALHGFYDVINFAFFMSGSYTLVILSVLTFITPLLIIELILRIGKVHKKGVNGL